MLLLQDGNKGMQVKWTDWRRTDRLSDGINVKLDLQIMMAPKSIVESFQRWWHLQRWEILEEKGICGERSIWVMLYLMP